MDVDDVDTTLPQPLAAVFAHLATPAHLGDWLADARAVDGGAQAQAQATGLLDADAVFGLRLRVDGHAQVATGELIAYEPPWLVSYRLCVGARTHIVRLACTAYAGGTRLRIHQGGAPQPLAIDLEPLRRALAAHEAANASDRTRGAADAPEEEKGGQGGQEPSPGEAP